MILINCFPICWPFQGLRINCLSLALNHTFCMWFWISWGDGLYGLLIWGTTIREITQLDTRYLYCWTVCYLIFNAENVFINTKHACESFSFLTFQGFFLKAYKALSTWLCLWAGSMVTRLITALLSTCTGPRQPIRRLGAASQASDWSRVAAPALSQTSSVTSHQLSQPLSADPDKKIYPGQNRERER